MALEYKKDMFFGSFVTIQDMYVQWGKYSFRDIYPERYFDENGKFIPNVKILDDENISHIDDGITPLFEEPFSKQEEEFLNKNHVVMRYVQTHVTRNL